MGEKVALAAYATVPVPGYVLNKLMQLFRTYTLVGDMLEALILPLTYPTTQTSLPFAPDLKRSPRLQVLDTGMLNYFSNVQREVFASNDLKNIHMGRIAEHVIAQELIAASDNYLQPLLFWVREKSDSNAEVDFLLSTSQGMIPIEVKSGATGHLKSLLLYMDETDVAGCPSVCR